MRTTQLGRTPLQVSALGFGCAGLGDEYGGMTDAQATEVVRFAMDEGFTYFDTSAYYGRGLSEERLGRALEGRRDDVVLATKGGRFDAPLETGFDFSKRGVIEMCEASLRRLRTDHIDVYQLHDIEFGDKEQVFDEAFSALVDLRDAGKIRYVGVTGYPTPLLREAIQAFDFDVVLTYCRYNLMDRSAAQELIPTAMERGTAVVNGSILHMGMLTAKGPQEWHPAPDRVKKAAGRAVAAAESRGVSISDPAIQFAAAGEGIDVTLLGSSKMSTIKASVAAASAVPDWDTIEAIETAIGPQDLNLSWRSGRPEHWEPDAIA